MPLWSLLSPSNMRKHNDLTGRPDGTEDKNVENETEGKMDAILRAIEM